MSGSTNPVPALLPVIGADLRAPLVQGGSLPYAGLDVAATAPALEAVAERVAAVLPYYGSAHRGAGYASRITTDLYEAARATIGEFVGADGDDVVVITRNTTDSLTLLAGCLPDSSTVLVLDIEHHANLLPWRRHDVRTVAAELTLESTIAAIEAALTERPTTLLAVTGASNVTGDVLPIARLARLAHAYGARICADAAQLAPHRRIDITADDIDYIAFSGHKLYAPFGAGVLAGRRDWLDTGRPHLPGGGAVREVTVSTVDWAPAPQRHEGGSPNVLGAVAIAAACDALAGLTPSEVEDHERALQDRLEAGLSTVDGLRILRIWPDAPDQVPVCSFVLDGFDPAQLAAILSAEHGIGVRDGRFCAHPLVEWLAPGGTAVRASLGLGSTSEHVDRLVTAVRTIASTGPRWAYARTSAGWVPTPDTRDLNPLDIATASRAEASPCESAALAS